MENLNISEKEIHVYFILSRSVQDERREGWLRRVAGRATRGFPFKRIIDESTYEIQRCLSSSATWEPWKYLENFPRGGRGPFGEISIPIILQRGIIGSLLSFFLFFSRN